ncbi:dehydrogenase RED2 [Trichoderma asperellum]|uniref:Dehydrogenase RED2 n=1 Tax=Trichoderma asperellum TaxID=101201 RepID=A0A6V8QPL6_TRIAP|nr:dehydrogenase RED2 [Trichoderma asperellum]
MAHSREGITLDLITRTIRNSFLSPFIVLPIVTGLSWQPARTRLFEYVHAEASSTALVVTYLLAALSVALSLNDYLNDGFANNWVRASDWDWNSEIVVITGGSGGIGEHVARQLLAKNIQTTIVILDCMPMTWTAPAKSKVHYYQVDLSNSSNIRTITQRIRDEVGHPTVLVNNAGLSRGFTVMDGSYIDVEVTIRTNLVAPFLLIKEFVPQMVSRNHGHIVNISSMSALIPPARVADYAATKAGLVALHEVNFGNR